MSTSKGKYYFELHQDGTEDAITICSPTGDSIACIFYWDEIEGATARAMANARLIVSALNASHSNKRKK